MKRITILKAVLKGIKDNKYNFLCVGMKVELKKRCNFTYNFNSSDEVFVSSFAGFATEGLVSILK